MAPIEKLTAEFWPGVPVLPILQAGATNGEFTNAVGILQELSGFPTL